MSDFKAKMHQNRFRLGLCPRPRWGSPRPLAGFKGPTSKGEGREGWKGKEGKRGREKEGREGMEGKNVLPHVKQAVAAYGDSQTRRQ